MEAELIGFLRDFLAGGAGPAGAILYVAWRLDKRISFLEWWVQDHDRRVSPK